MNEDDPPLPWLLQSGDPSIEYLTLTEVLDMGEGSPRVRAAKDRIPESPRVRSLFAGQRDDGGFGVHPYKKWTGAHWRLVSLVELGLPPGDRRAEAAANQVLKWLLGDAHRRGIKRVKGLTRRCASQEGNALAVCSRLGLTDDPRVSLLARSLEEWQWPDGGWNCDKEEDVHHSSFYETLAPLWGLVEFYRATGDGDSLETAKRAGELFLRHRMFRSETTDEVIDQAWLKLHYPLYWHYDILQGLLIISRLGMAKDSRTTEALDVLESKRLPDSTWRPEGYYWRPPGGKGSQVEVVDWGRGAPNYMITLNAIRVLRAAGRIE